MFSSNFMFFAISVIVIVYVKSAKILMVTSIPSLSHQLVFRPLVQELINRDHEIVMITPDPAFPQGKAPKNLREIGLHDLSYGLWQKVYSTVTKTDFLSVMTVTYSVAHEVFQEQLKDKSVQKLVSDKTVKFDLLILEECVKPALIYSHIFKAPAIVMSSFGDCRGSMSAIGALTHPLVYPTQLHQRIYNLTDYEKLNELYDHIAFKQMLENQDILVDRFLQNLLGIDTPTLDMLQRNVHALFLNVHPVWMHNQPAPSNFIYTWGIHKTPAKTLPKDLQAYLDSSKNGVIYVSFGTNFKTTSMQPKTLEVFLNVFSQLPYNILWKWDTDELPGKSKNIYISKWFPQNDILRHPNVKLFITQGGLQSTDEAIDAGVPLIGFPIFADQEYNTENYVHLNIGTKLHFGSLTTEKLKNSINTILANYDSYRNNIINLRRKLYDQPQPALQRATWWIEYILRHGGARHLRAPAASMCWTEYYELELVCVLLCGLTVLATVLLLTLCSCFKCSASCARVL